MDMIKWIDLKIWFDHKYIRLIKEDFVNDWKGLESTKVNVNACLKSHVFFYFFKEKFNLYLIVALNEINMKKRQIFCNSTYLTTKED